MATKEVSNHLVHITDQDPEDVAQALIEVAGLTTTGYGLLDASQISQTIQMQRDPMTGKLRFPVTGRMFSVPFENETYMLKFGIEGRTKPPVIWISTHPGETPGVGPIKATANLVDQIATSKRRR